MHEHRYTHVQDGANLHLQVVLVCCFNHHLLQLPDGCKGSQLLQSLKGDGVVDLGDLLDQTDKKNLLQSFHVLPQWRVVRFVTLFLFLLVCGGRRDRQGVEDGDDSLAEFKRIELHFQSEVELFQLRGHILQDPTPIL